MTRDEQPVHVIDRQRVQQDVAAGEAPELHQRQRVAREIAMGEHRAFGPAGRPRRVDDRRDVVRLRYDRVESLRLIGRRDRASVPAPLASVSTCASGRSARDALGGPRAADDDRRLRVAEEIGELALLVARVERQIHEAGAQAGEVERERLPALVHLHGHAIARLRPAAVSACAIARGCRVELVIVDDRLLRDQQARLLRAFGEMRGEKRVEVGVHARERLDNAHITTIEGARSGGIRGELRALRSGRMSHPAWGEGARNGVTTAGSTGAAASCQITFSARSAAI